MSDHTPTSAALSRLAPTILVLALLVATAAAFAVAQRRKLEPIAITGPRIDPRAFSPGCRCPSPETEIGFRLARADTVDASLVGEDGEVVRRLLLGARRPRGPVGVRWDGRDGAGRVVPDGTYYLRVRLRGEGRTFDTPARVLVDTKPPRARIVSARPRTLREGRGRVLVEYRLSERARPEVHVDGRRVVGPARARAHGFLEWWGRLERRPAPPGRYELTLVARDAAGNASRRSAPVLITIE